MTALTGEWLICARATLIGLQIPCVASTNGTTIVFACVNNAATMMVNGVMTMTSPEVGIQKS